MKNLATTATEILAQMGGDAETICSGDCPEFAKRLVDACGGVIVDALNGEAMKAELDGYEITTPSVRVGRFQSHCYVKGDDGRFYDAYNPDGCDNEEDMDWREKI